MAQFTRRSILGGAQTAAALAAGAAAPQALAAPRPKQRPRATLIQGADLLTMDPQLGELREMDVLVQGGKIAAIGKGLTASDAEVVAAKDHILMPGMVDGHRHSWLDIGRGAHVKFDLTGYRDYQPFKLRAMAAMWPEDHYLGELYGCLLALDSGVTCLLDFPHGQTTVDQAVAAARGARDSGIGGWHGFQLGINIDFKPGDTISYERANDRYMVAAEPKHWAMAEAVRDRVFNDPGAPMQFALGPCNLMNIPIESIKATMQRIRAMGVGLIPIHIAPPLHTLREMHEQGLLGPDLHLTHANQLDDADLKLVAETGGMICSTTMGEFPYVAAGQAASIHGRARAAGVPAGIGVDVPEALPQDYFEHVRSAHMNLFLSEAGQKLVLGYKSADVLDFATAMGARALRLGDVTGSIRVGKRADLVLLRTDRGGFPARGSLADRVLTFASLQDIDSVWVMGMARKRHGRLVGHDLAKVKAQVAAAQEQFLPIAATVKFT